MFLSRVEIPWGKAKNPYGLHKAIWTLFPGSKKEPRRYKDERREGFLFHVEETLQGQPARVLVQSQRTPLQSSEGTRVIAVKEFGPKPQVGQELSFVLTANPVKTIDDENGRLNAKGSIKKCRVQLIREEQQIKWLNDRLSGKASVKFVKVRPLPPIFFYKYKEKRDGKLVPVLYEGVIVVTEPQGLINLLENGIGPAKAFGCGLMLVRRA